MCNVRKRIGEKQWNSEERLKKGHKMRRQERCAVQERRGVFVF